VRVVSGISITGSVIDPVDRLGVTSEPRTAVTPDTVGSLLHERSPASPRLAAGLRSPIEAASKSFAGPGSIALSPSANDIALGAPTLQPAAVEDPASAEEGQIADVGGADSSSMAKSVINPIDDCSEASESRLDATLGSIDSLLRELSRDMSAAARPAAELRSAVDAAATSSAEPGVIAPSPSPNNVVPLWAAAVEKLGGQVAAKGDVSGISVARRNVDQAERLSQEGELAAELRSAVDAASASSEGYAGIALSPGPTTAAPAEPAPQPAAPASAVVEDPVLKELDKLIARLDAGLDGLASPPSDKPSAKTSKSRFFC
jgi:hypothetical protein